MAKTDFAPTDDQAPIPIPPMPELSTVEEDLAQDEVEETKKAQAFWHPAWAEVQKLYDVKREEYGDPLRALKYSDLPAEEFKIKMLTEAAVYAEIVRLEGDVKDAVAAVERHTERPKQPKRPIKRS